MLVRYQFQEEVDFFLKSVTSTIVTQIIQLAILSLKVT